MCCGLPHLSTGSASSVCIDEATSRFTCVTACCFANWELTTPCCQDAAPLSYRGERTTPRTGLKPVRYPTVTAYGHNTDFALTGTIIGIMSPEFPTGQRNFFPLSPGSGPPHGAQALPRDYSPSPLGMLFCFVISTDLPQDEECSAGKRFPPPSGGRLGGGIS